MIVQLVVASGHRTGQVIPVSEKKFIAGRAEDCHLRLRSELISRYHCAILVADDEVVVRDLGSKNGVQLNGKKVNTEQKLSNGDRLGIGPLEFFVHVAVGDDPLAGLPTDRYDDSAVSWIAHSKDNAGEVQTATVLLEHLKSLNPTVAEPEQPVLNLLKKFQ